MQGRFLVARGGERVYCLEMANKKTVSVTEDHIKNGLRFMCGKCPVALAVSEHTGRKALVGSHTLDFADNDFMYFKPVLPRSVRRFIKRFDRGLSVKPFKFILPMKDGK